MSTFKQLTQTQHESVVYCYDHETGLRAIIGIHNTTLGPALGGCRMKSYQSEEDALRDVLRLSKAMTYKSSLAGLNLGGGKSVVILDHPEQKTPELLTAFAKRINMLGGSYIGAGDIGSNTQDLKFMKQTCPWITGLAVEDGGLGDSAILTSLGVFMGIKAAAKFQLHADSLEGLRVSMQGLGKVGYMLMEKLIDAGCQVTVTDVNPQALERAKLEFPSIQVVEPKAIFSTEADIFSPNAIGGVITPQVAQSIPVAIVAGAANNILLNDEAGQVLHDRQILYAPDFLINAGGVMMVASELKHESFEMAEANVRQIYGRTMDVFQRSADRNITPHEAAMAIAQERIDHAKLKNDLKGKQSSLRAATSAAASQAMTLEMKDSTASTSGKDDNELLSSR